MFLPSCFPDSNRSVVEDEFAGIEHGPEAVLEGLLRFLLETWRGDADRGVWSGLGGLSTGRVTALGFVLVGCALFAWLRRAPALSVER